MNLLTNIALKSGSRHESMFRYNALRVMHDATGTCIRTNTRAFLSCSRPMSYAFLNVTNVPILRDLLLFRWTFFINSSNRGNGKANCAKTRKEIEERPNIVSCISFISLSLSLSLLFFYLFRVSLQERV